MINSPEDLVLSNDKVLCGKCEQVAEPPRKVCRYCASCGTFYVVFCDFCADELKPDYKINMKTVDYKCWSFKKNY